ncbi:MAG: aldo/keto reductase [Armatimonadota bacterium]
MQYTRLGKTNLSVSRTSFGVLPLQRAKMEEAVLILRRAFDGGMNFFDTARAYSDSEEKIGAALAGVRNQIFVATKTHAKDRTGLFEHLETSLRNLQTDHVDILQLHNPERACALEGAGGLYEALVEARDKGMVRFLGITNHRLDVSLEAAASGLYDTVQFPISSISDEKDLAIIDACKQHNVGLIAMKALSGGLITNAASAFAFLRQYDNVVPIWGIQQMHELEEILTMEANPPALDEAMWRIIDSDRSELAGRFCRACGYCLPCPAGIPIPMAGRMSLLLRRMPYQQFLSDDWKADMERIKDCTHCDHCKAHCPYGLDTPAMLQEMLKDYEEFYLEHKN